MDERDQVLSWEYSECHGDDNIDDDDLGDESQPLNVEQELERFRLQWQQELEQAPLNVTTTTEPKSGTTTHVQPTQEEQAKYLFLQGVDAEQAGRLYDAIKYYRRAVQLVPDIEFRIHDYRPRRRRLQDSESSGGGASSDVDVEDLVQHFTNLRANENAPICTAELETTTASQRHISALPMELLLLIFKWVVSSDLDFLSLVRLSEVCRGFFVCARDDELWRLICQRVYGRNCGRPGSYVTYRNMFLERPHVLCNGCYISRQEYFREGEKSLDGLYRPYHLVEYFRYVRFFPDGEILMLTSPEDPHQQLRHLRHKSTTVQGVLHGYYRVTDDKVTALLKRRKVIEVQPYYYRYKGRRQNINSNESEQSFQVEFSLRNVGRRLYRQLVWTYYAVHTIYKSTGQEQIADFELSNDKYPPLYFSRVKSYTATAQAPLE